MDVAITPSLFFVEGYQLLITLGNTRFFCAHSVISTINNGQIEGSAPLNFIEDDIYVYTF